MAGVMLVLGGILVLLIALLTIPLTIVFSIHRTKDTEGLIRIGWLFGLVRFKLTLPRDSGEKSGGGATSPTRKGEKAASSRQRRKKGNRQGLFELLRQLIFRQCVVQFIRDVLAATHAEDLFLRLRIGTGDPADTGQLWAMIGPIAGLVRNIKSIDFYIEPEFMQALFEIESHGRFRLVPIQFIYLLIRFLLSMALLANRSRWRVKAA